MAEHIWSVLCYKASIDQADNLVSLLDVPEKLAAQIIPGTESVEKQLAIAKKKKITPLIPVKLQLVSWWVRSDPEKPEQSISRLMLSPPNKGKRLKYQEFAVNLTDNRSVRHRIVLETIPFLGFGYYWFVVELKSGKGWRRVARIPLELGPPVPSKT